VAEFKDSPNNRTPDKDIIKEIEVDNEKQYLKELKKRNEGFLVENLSILERERIAQYIVDRFNDVKTKHNDICDKMDENDEVFRMQRAEVKGSDGELPNYRSPLSTVSVEVVHSNYMNVFFTPKDLGRVLPTEEGDIDKVDKLTTFMNWSAREELEMFENIDRLFHNSTKNGEAPYLMHWVKEYGTQIKRKIIPNPSDPSQPMYDIETKEPIFQEVEEEVLIYNGPKLVPFSRKDYYQPKNAVMGKTPEWEMMRTRLTYDEYLRDQLAGKMYPGTIQEIKDWGSEQTSDTKMFDFDGDTIPAGKWEKQFVTFFGRLRIRMIKTDADDQETIKMEELEDEFIAIVNIESNVLCQLRRNKFPMKQRPIGMDYFMPDDEGRRAALGIVEFMKSLQTGYDALYNQFVLATVNSNNPIGFFEPVGNMRDEKIKLQNGFMYPTSNASGVKLFQWPAPNASLQTMLQIINTWAQLLFGISDFQAGIDSRTDPDAPAKKTEIVVQQGNVRMNAIIKRKNKTIKDILKRWFLLYQDNMPPNKFMRITGDQDNIFRFNNITLDDFSLNSLPDFEMVGNILNVNKSLEINKAIGTYQLLIQNPFFSPQTQPGIKALFNLTKWLIDKLDEVGLSAFLPNAPQDNVRTPEEENARFLQGETGTPGEGEDHLNHIKVHRVLLGDPNIPEEIKVNVIQHINETVKMMQQERVQQLATAQQPQQGGQDAGQGVLQPGGQGQGGGGGQGPQGASPGVVQGQPAGVV